MTKLLIAKPVIASEAKQSLFRYVPQARPRLHACTTSATADLRPAPYEAKVTAVLVAFKAWHG